MVVSYKGALYVEAGHKKCERGTHWNSRHKECQKLPLSLAKKITKAENRSAEAYYASLKGKSKSAVKRHELASKAHNDASAHAARHSFLGLASKHSALGAKHKDLAYSASRVNKGG